MVPGRKDGGVCAGSPFHLVPREGILSALSQFGSACVIAAGQETMVTPEGKESAPPPPGHFSAPPGLVTGS